MHCQPFLWREVIHISGIQYSRGPVGYTPMGVAGSRIVGNPQVLMTISPEALAGHAGHKTTCSYSVCGVNVDVNLVPRVVEQRPFVARRIT